MAETILVLAEQRDGKLNPQSLETVVAGQRFAEENELALSLALFGKDLTAAADELASADAAKLWLVEHALLEPYTADAYCTVARSVIEELHPAWVFLPHTYQVRDFAPRLAAIFRRALISDCVGFRDEGGKPVFVRQMFQGKTHADVVALGDDPHFVSFQADSFHSDQLRQGAESLATEKLEIGLSSEQIRSKAEAPAHAGERGVDLSQAEIIVGVGRGIQSPETIDMVQQLAAAIGGDIGASRPVCDEGWLPIERQIGRSGQTVTPKLYLALGISGSAQHIVGVKGARTIAAVNTDPNAPIFRVADYGIVGDLTEVVPALIEALRDAG